MDFVTEGLAGRVAGEAGGADFRKAPLEGSGFVRGRGGERGDGESKVFCVEFPAAGELDFGAFGNF